MQKKFFLPTYLPYFFFGPLQETNNLLFLGLISSDPTFLSLSEKSKCYLPTTAKKHIVEIKPGESAIPIQPPAAIIAPRITEQRIV